MVRILAATTVMAALVGAAWAGSTPHAVTSTEPVSRLEILPGFEPHEVLDSIDVTLDAALRCAVQGKPTLAPESLPAAGDFFRQLELDGMVLEPTTRSVEFRCKAHPVHQCTFHYTWAQQHQGVAYAVVECIGLERGRQSTYSVTATIDITGPKRATGTAKGTRHVALNFVTDAFPGTNTWVSMEQRRSDLKLTRPPSVSQFDDFTTKDEARDDLLTDVRLEAAALRVIDVACATSGLATCVSGRPTRPGR